MRSTLRSVCRVATAPTAAARLPIRRGITASSSSPPSSSTASSMNNIGGRRFAAIAIGITGTCVGYAAHRVHRRITSAAPAETKSSTKPSADTKTDTTAAAGGPNPHHGDDEEDEGEVVLTPEELTAIAALRVSLSKAETKANASKSVIDQYAVVQLLVQLDDYEQMAEWLAKIVVPDHKLSSDPEMAKKERATISKAAENLAQLSIAGLGISDADGDDDSNNKSGQRLLERAITVDPTNNSARTGLAFLLLSSDYDRASSLLRQAADQDYPTAQFALAMLLGKGKKDGTHKDAAGAVSYLERAAKHGHSQAMVTLARCLLTGTGTPKDAARAVILVRQAAAMQETEALIVMSELLISGQGDLPSLPDGVRVEKNEAEGMTMKQQLSGHGIRRRANWP